MSLKVEYVDRNVEGVDLAHLKVDQYEWASSQPFESHPVCKVRGFMVSQWMLAVAHISQLLLPLTR